MMLHKGLYTAFPICVLVSESRMWLPSAARWIKVNLEHIALIFKLYFFLVFSCKWAHLWSSSTMTTSAGFGKPAGTAWWVHSLLQHMWLLLGLNSALQCWGEKQKWTAMEMWSVGIGADNWNPSLHSRILGWAEAALSLHLLIWKC